MRIYVLFLLMFGGFYFSVAQSTTDSVYVAKSFLGYRFYQNDTRLNFNQLPYVMEENGEAYYVIKKAKSNYTISTIISGTGGFILGWQLASALFSGEPNWVLAGVGGGLIVISIPIYSKSYRQSLDAIELHNKGIAASAHRLDISFGTTANGAGLIVKF